MDNTGLDNAALYTQPANVWDVYTTLNLISPNFSITATFGNANGVYKSGNVKLHPDLLEKHQEYVTKQLQGTVKKPL